MNIKYHFAFIMLLVFNLFQNDVISQSLKLTGTVYEISEKGNIDENIPLVNVNVYWPGTSTGTITDETGTFTINRPEYKDLYLVFSYVGYKDDTILIEKDLEEINIVLQSGEELDEVVIEERIDDSYISKINPVQTQVITACGLQKMACCNLSESFENSASVDVEYSDAITGAKQLQLLGLAGKYSQILLEKRPIIRGLGSFFGISYIPGPWMESLQISKGTASVVTGYESTTGQINIEFRKPETSDPLFVNLYTDYHGKMEGSLISSAKLGKSSSTMIFAYGSHYNNKIDRNEDTFLDIPLNSIYNIMNRWEFNFNSNWMGQVDLNILQEDRLGGQINFNEKTDIGTTNYYGAGIKTKRYEISTKSGIRLNEKNTNLAFFGNAIHHNLDSYFGLNNYKGIENNLNTSIIFQSNIINEDHNINSGISYMFDEYEEQYNDTLFTREESVPGIFSEYTYNYESLITLMLGMRIDINNMYGTFYTPRIHFMYNVDDNTTLRGSAGKGYRTANIFAENIGILASSRTLIFEEELKAEEAWNYGVNVTRDFPVDIKRKVTINIDFYRTDFLSQVVADMDQSSDKVVFYNLTGKSYSNSFQAEIIFEPVIGLKILTAYRWNDVKITINNKLRAKPLVSKYKGLLVLSYTTDNDKWNFDCTVQLNGKTRLPDTMGNPEEYRKEETSPEYVIVHTKITRKFKNWDIYIGSENLTDYRQKDPIIAADDPFGEYFDSSMIWGPVIGRKIYAGLRYNLKR